jgi:hypothetical protein
MKGRPCRTNTRRFCWNDFGHPYQRRIASLRKRNCRRPNENAFPVVAYVTRRTHLLWVTGKRVSRRPACGKFCSGQRVASEQQLGMDRWTATGLYRTVFRRTYVAPHMPDAKRKDLKILGFACQDLNPRLLTQQQMCELTFTSSIFSYLVEFVRTCGKGWQIGSHMATYLD